MKVCSKCKQEKSLDCFTKSKTMKDGLNGRCRICTAEDARVYRAKYPDRSRASSKKYATLHPEKKKASQRTKPAEYHREWRAKNPEKVKAGKEKYLMNHPEKRHEWKSKRLNSLAIATPKWLTSEQKQEIAEFYKSRKHMSEFHEEEYHVDHIEPLRGKTSWGLHVPWNLRVIPAKENMAKHNKLI